jgi:hypothetical protein
MSSGRFLTMLASVVLALIVWGTKTFLGSGSLPPTSISSRPNLAPPATLAGSPRQQPTILEANSSPDGRSIESPRQLSETNGCDDPAGDGLVEGPVAHRSPEPLASPTISLLPSR